MITELFQRPQDSGIDVFDLDVRVAKEESSCRGQSLSEYLRQADSPRAVGQVQQERVLEVASAGR